MQVDNFGDWLAAQRCEGVNLVPGAMAPIPCDRTGDHRQAGKTLCGKHLDQSPRAPRAFATND